jgi:hypothetical protein
MKMEGWDYLGVGLDWIGLDWDIEGRDGWRGDDLGDEMR